MHFQLAEPAWLTLISIAALPWIWARSRRRLNWPTLEGFARAPIGKAGLFRWLPPVIRALAVIALAVALARPRTVGGQVRVAAKGVAIVAAIDQSSTMKTADFPAEGGTIPRLEAAKTTFARFVEGRPDDLVGLVSFANFPELLCTPTLNHRFLIEQASAIRPARPGEDGTNIGDAIAWALDALRKSPPKRKVIILLTDGRNDPAVPDPWPPEEAARDARALGVTLHTIAIGGTEAAVRQTESVTKLDHPNQYEGPDLELLRNLADLGGGRAFVARSTADLESVFAAIDALERSPLTGTISTRYREWYPLAIGIALCFLFLDRLLVAGPLRRLP